MISVSALSAYVYCPRKAYLTYVMKLIPWTKAPMVKGKVKHDVLDAISKNEETLIRNINPSNIDKIDVIYKEAYSDLLKKSISKFEEDIKGVGLNKDELFQESLKKFLGEAVYRAKKMAFFAEKTGLFGVDLFNALPVKYKSELFLSSRKLRLRGVIDRVEITGEEHTPIELKTGSMPREGIWPGHKVQLASYILLLKENFNSNQGFVEYLDHEVRRKIVMNPFLEDEMIQLVTKVLDAFNSGDIPEVCGNPNKCNNCNLKDSCFKLS